VISLAALLAASALAAGAGAEPRPVHAYLDCGGRSHRISPSIYGIANGDAHGTEWKMGATARRWGGNANSRYNWKAGNAWNAGGDWFFRNVNYASSDGSAWERWLSENAAHGMSSALTVPTIGWVAKDTTSYGFPVSVVGPQEATAPELPDAGNGKRPGGALVAPLAPTQTSVPAPPAFVAEWVRTIGARRGPGAVHTYILDNEPALWHLTHRDVHPSPVTYDELLERVVAYASAIRAEAPDARIAAPAAWGWTEYFYSAADGAAGYALAPDRRRHGNKPLLPWLLEQVRRHEQRTGKRLLDVVDVHFYPQAEGVGIGREGRVDPATSRLRIRATRALWDPTYVDESWIAEPVMLIPRLRAWIEENAPGLDVSIGEWNFGAEGHVSGGLAVAQALGIFGRERVGSAFYWTVPPPGSPAYHAFRAYRDYDGRGGRFLERFVPAGAGSRDEASLFASRGEDGRRIVAVLLNLSLDTAARARVELRRCPPRAAARAFQFTGEPAGFRAVPDPQATRDGVEVVAPAGAITVLEIDLAQPLAPARAGAP
jgi:hypothetical protein